MAKQVEKVLAAADKGEIRDKIEAQLAQIMMVPEGFVALFNGKDLTGWKGIVGKGGSPISRATMTRKELAEAQQEADKNMREHWKVVDSELVFDGKGHNLCTVKDYRNFELLVDWKIEKGGNSEIYLRGIRKFRCGIGPKVLVDCIIIRKDSAKPSNVQMNPQASRTVSES